MNCPNKHAMTPINNIYQQHIVHNQNDLHFCETYINQLKSLDFHVYADKLKVPVLVPLGSRIYFRGELQHTNEVITSMGADYFTKCSVAQADILRQRRIKEAEAKLDTLKKEKQFLENRISFAKENVFAHDGQEILEEYCEEEEKAWREKHREKMRNYKQSQASEEAKPKDTSDAELWQRLEELELQEELENELLYNYNEIVDKRKENTFLQNEEALLRNTFKEENNNQQNKETVEVQKPKIFVDSKNSIIQEKSKEPNNNDKPNTNDTSKNELLLKVLDKQTELENKLHELKNQDREPSKTEQDLIARLNEMEQLYELEDEMDRLEDIIEAQDVDTDDSEVTSNSSKSESGILKKSITFADDNDDAETLEIEFSHTDTEPNNEPYDPAKGITKPSDVYAVYSGLFGKTTSILKKSKYGSDPMEEPAKMSTDKPRRVMFEEKPQTLESFEPEEREITAERTIIIKDVVENVGVNQHHIEGGARPTSLFKKKRMQKK